MIQLFQQRDFGNKINATFQYIVENFRSLGMALLYIVGPVALVSGIASGILQSDMLKLMGGLGGGSTRSNNPMAIFQMLNFFSSPSYWLVILFGLLANVAVVLVTYAHMKVYERNRGQDVSVTDIWTEMQPAIGRAIIISVLSSILTFVAMMFFIIPGIYVAVVLSLSLAVTVFEGTDFGRTFDRCFKLIRDKWWSTFGLIVVMVIIVLIVGMVFAIPTALIGLFVGMKALPDISTGWLIVGNVIALVGRTLLNAVVYLAIGFQYTNLVERQEGRGLLSDIDSIGTPVQPRPRNDGEY
jgi:hypothetical protein